MSRLPELNTEEMNSSQRKVYDSIVSGVRGKAGGPWIPLLHSPELAHKVEQLGVYVRYECKVPERQRELLICCVAAHWRADYEWYSHSSLALKAGITPEVLAAIGEGVSPQLEDEKDACAFAFASELLKDGRVSELTYANSLELFGQTGTVDMTGLLGYYSLLAMTLNTFEVGVPDGADIPFQSSAS